MLVIRLHVRRPAALPPVKATHFTSVKAAIQGTTCSSISESECVLPHPPPTPVTHVWMLHRQASRPFFSFIFSFLTRSKLIAIVYFDRRFRSHHLILGCMSPFGGRASVRLCRLRPLVRVSAKTLATILTTTHTTTPDPTPLRPLPHYCNVDHHIDQLK